MPVRTKWLGGGDFTDAAAHVLYTTPAGYTTIVKWGNIAWPVTSPYVQFLHQVSGGPLVPAGGQPGGYGPANTFEYPMWEVLGEGDQFLVQGDGTAEFTCSFSGTELFGVATP